MVQISGFQSKKSVLKALPSVVAIYVTLGLNNDDEGTITITKAQFKKLLEGVDSNAVLTRLTVYSNDHGLFISI